jgi:glutathione S-transferase
MITLHHAPNTRSVRIVWLLEELGLPYHLERVRFEPPVAKFFGQQTPTGKLPTLVDGEVVMCESGAIAEYLLERYGAGRLAPAIGSPARARYLQWLHFAEGTAFPPLGILVWLSRYRGESDRYAELVTDTRERAAAGLDYLEREFGVGPWLVGADFSAADIMMGFALVAAKMLGVLSAERHPTLVRYLAALEARPAYAKARAA